MKNPLLRIPDWLGYLGLPFLIIGLVAFVPTGCGINDWSQVVESPAANFGAITSLFLLSVGALLILFGVAGAAARAREEQDQSELGSLLIAIASVIGLASFVALVFGTLMSGFACCSGTRLADAVIFWSLIGLGIALFCACSVHVSSKMHTTSAEKSAGDSAEK